LLTGGGHLVAAAGSFPALAGDAAMKLILAACAAALLMALPACNRSAEASSAAPQIDLPMVAAGKWHWRQQVDGKDGGFPASMCYPERTLWEVLEVGAAGIKSCERTIEKTGQGYAARYACKTRQTAATIEATISGDFKSNYRLESLQKFDPAVGGVTQQRITVQAERSGDC
jgi:hypothetical protein